MPTPSLSPIALPPVICAECTNMMEAEIQRTAQGKLSGIVYSCKRCGYAHRASLQYISGESFIPKKVQKP